MKKRIYLLVIAAILVCGLSVTASIALSSSEEAKAQNEESAPKVESTELIRTSQSWDGVELPDYLQGRPELVAVKYVFPVGQKLGWHHHPVMNYGVLMQGELTIIGQDGKEKVVHEGEAVVEMVNTIHHGENRGSVPVVLYMFYLSQEGRPWPCSIRRYHWSKTILKTSTIMQKKYLLDDRRHPHLRRNSADIVQQGR